MSSTIREKMETELEKAKADLQESLIKINEYVEDPRRTESRATVEKMSSEKVKKLSRTMPEDTHVSQKIHIMATMINSKRKYERLLRGDFDLLTWREEVQARGALFRVQDKEQIDKALRHDNDQRKGGGTHERKR